MLACAHLATGSPRGGEPAWQAFAPEAGGVSCCTGLGKGIGMRVARRKRLGSRPAMGVTVAAVAFVLAACAPTAPAKSPGAGSGSGGAIALNYISTLKSPFNPRRDHTRLALLFSPTSPTSLPVPRSRPP